MSQIAMMHDHFDKGEASELELKLGYKFKNIELLREGLSHPSLKQIDDKKKHVDYERLELLGDSILGFVIIENLYQKFDSYSEGNLSKIKAFLVSKELLYKISYDKLSLADYVVMTKGEENSGGRENPSNVENALEAIIAAIYLDSDISTVRNIILKLWQEYIHDFDPADIDPKSTLQEWAQKNKYPIPDYSTIEQEGPVHSPIFKVEVAINGIEEKSTGKGKSIKVAQKKAAKALLMQLQKK